MLAATPHQRVARINLIDKRGARACWPDDKDRTRRVSNFCGCFLRWRARAPCLDVAHLRFKGVPVKRKPRTICRSTNFKRLICGAIVANIDVGLRQRARDQRAPLWLIFAPSRQHGAHRIDIAVAEREPLRLRDALP